MHASKIRKQNEYLLKRQREFRMAADVACDALVSFEEVQAVAVIGSVAKRLWKEIPRFSEFRRARIEVWHECSDLDLAVWIDRQDRLGELRKAVNRSLSAAFVAGKGISIVGQQLDIFLIEPGTDRYLGRLCHFGQCPKPQKIECVTPGCGTPFFNKRIPGFTPHADLLAAAEYSTLYQRGTGRLRSALDLPEVEDDESCLPH